MSSQVGDCIEGERIYFRFGEVRVQQGGRQQIAKLGLNGEAKMLKPLKTAQATAQKSYPTIRCLAAEGRALKVNVDKSKQHIGKHRAFVGYLEGAASCRVTLASPREQRGS